MRRDWRVEADDAWLKQHSGRAFARRRLSRLRAIAGATSDSVLSGTVLGGPARNPSLHHEGGSSWVRQAEKQYAFTNVQVVPTYCPRCGYFRLERHVVNMVRSDGQRQTVGTVSVCSNCQRNSWMFVSQMSRAREGRDRDARVVL